MGDAEKGETTGAHLVDGKYRFKDLVDLDTLKKIMERFSRATGFTTGLVSFPDQELLFGTGWRDICIKFHRACSESEAVCKESNVALTSQLRQQRELNVQPCDHGLVDGATPVIINGAHVASLATGQSLFQEPDREEFRARAARFGYDEEAYLEALDQVPVVSEERLKTALSFLSDLAVMIGELGLKNLNLLRTTANLEAEVTRRKQVEEELRLHRTHLEEQVESRTRELKQAMAELERSNRDLEQFARFASHDLKEPVRMMASFSQMLAKRYSGKLDDKAEGFIEHIVGGADRVGSMLRGLQEYASISATDHPLGTVSCASVLDQIRDNLGLLIEENGARLTCGELPRVMARESQLLILFQNLISNAIKYRGEQAPEVHVSARREGDTWTLSVRDNGIGIEPVYLERIFALFSRVDRNLFPGEGVGLALCQRIVELHGGRIWVESTPGAGSEFFFTLPAGGDE